MNGKSATGFSALSFELLDKIFEDFYPVSYLKPRPWFYFESKFTSFTNKFTFAREFCMGLRLLNRQFYHILTPHIYSHIFLPIYPTKSFLRVSQAARHHPELIKFLFLEGIDHVDEDFQRTSIHLLHHFLSACFNLQAIHLTGPENLFWQVTQSRIHRILSSTSSLLTSLTIQFGSHWGVHATLGGILIGLSHVASQLEHLNIEFHNEYDTGITLEDRPITVPRLFPNIKTLALRNCPDAFAIKLLSRIHCEGGTPHRHHLNSNCTDRTTSYVTPLRDLTLTYLTQTSFHILDFLKINNLSLSLTALQILTFEGHSQLHECPSQIFLLCPNLERFIYLAPFPLSALHRLPAPLRALGVHFDEGGLLVPECLSHPNELVDVVTSGNGLTELYVDEVLEQRRMKKLKEACTANGVRLTGFWNEGPALFFQFISG